MEAIGAGANVVTFVVLSLKSAKLVHDTLSAIKDGPAFVQSLAASFLELHFILERLLQSRDTSLQGQARKCCEDLNKLASTIERLQVPPGERATGRFWKRLKAAISENDLKKLDAWVTRQASLLNARLNVLSRDWNERILQQIGSTSTANICTTRDGNERILQQIDSMSTSMQTQFDSQTATFLDATKNLTNNLNDQGSTIEALLSSVHQAIEAANFISSQNARTVVQGLEEIKDRIAPQSKGGAEASDVKGDGERDTRSVQKVLESIDSLCSLIDEKRDAVDAYGEDDDLARSAITNLEELVQNLRAQKLSVSDAMSFENDLGLFRKWFGSGDLSINSGVRISPRPLTRVLEQTRSCIEADIGVGRLRLMVQKRKRAIDTEDQNDNELRPTKRCPIDWIMNLAFLPGSGQDRHMLLASLTRQGTMSSISRLQVNRVLPWGSLVFRLVEQGDLQGLKEMLLNGRASLQDHDQYGSPLLCYSMKQPEMCKFLLENGLDVDVHGSQALNVDLDEEESLEPEELRRRIECRRLLLRAGADPALPSPRFPWARNFLEGMTLWGKPELIEFAWNPELITPFANIKTYRGQDGITALSSVCRSLEYISGIEKRLHHLFQAGADIQERDKEGRTCLHICMDHLRPHINPSFDSSAFEVFKCLLRQGADPRAVDSKGRSVSEIAYTMPNPPGMITSLPSDLWDAALHSCGFDISEFRSGHRRRARYTTPAHNQVSEDQYTRQDFERLWEGREVECPYWDDEPWPPLGPAEEDSDDESQELECACYKCREHNFRKQSKSDPEHGTEEEWEQPNSGGGGSTGWQQQPDSDVYMAQSDDGEQPESGIEDATGMGHIDTFLNGTDTLPGFGDLAQGMLSENWQDFLNLQPSIVGTPPSFSMDFENPWL